MSRSETEMLTNTVSKKEPESKALFYQRGYLKKKDIENPSIYSDEELGIDFFDDFFCPGEVFCYLNDNDPEIISKVNLLFLKILVCCEVIVINKSKIIKAKEYFEISDISKIMGKLKEYYLADKFRDDDLDDDNFSYWKIVSPVDAYDRNMQQDFFDKHRSEFQNQDECNKFLKDRSKLFCLYVFLRRCAILYRDTIYKKPLELLLDFLKNKKIEIRVKPFMAKGDNWNTGLHEWLTCESTFEALERTAGKKKGVSPCIKPFKSSVSIPNTPLFNSIWRELNWIDFQFLVRTPTKYVIFARDMYGHAGAVNKSEYPRDARVGAVTKGQNAFHKKINKKFKDSKTIVEFMIAISVIYKNEILNPTTAVLNPSKEPNYLVDGSKTNDIEQIRAFKQHKLQEPSMMLDVWLRDFVCQSDILQEEGCIYTFKQGQVLPISKESKKERQTLIKTYFFKDANIEQKKLKTIVELISDYEFNIEQLVAGF